MVAGGRQFRLSGVNVARGNNRIYLYTKAVGPNTRAKNDGAELVLRLVKPGPVRLGADAAVEVVGLRDKRSGAPLAAGTVVLSAAGTGANTLRSLWKEMGRGLSRSAVLRLGTGPNVVESIGGTPVLLQGGNIVVDTTTSFAKSRNPRSMIGWNAAGDVWLVAIDGRQPASVGMSLASGASFLRSLGATEGFNFDGGGGAELVVKGTVVSKPNHKTTKKPITKIKERSAVNAWVVVSR